MNRLPILAAVAVFAFVAGCSSPEERASQADADMKQKRMQLADDYQECTKKANAYEAAKKDGTANDLRPSDQVEMSTCDDIMKTMEALK